MAQIISLEELREKAENEQPISDINVEDIVADKMLKAQLRKVVAALSEEKRNVIELRYFENMNVYATAKELGISSATVVRREKAALADLKEALIAYA